MLASIPTTSQRAGGDGDVVLDAVEGVVAPAEERSPLDQLERDLLQHEPSLDVLLLAQAGLVEGRALDLRPEDDEQQGGERDRAGASEPRPPAEGDDEE